jgi:hypothetical protein
MSAPAHPPRERSPSAGRSTGGRLLVVALGAAVIAGLGAGFAIGSTTKGSAQGGASSTLAPAITISSTHVASVPAPYAIAVIPSLHRSAKAHAAPGGQASGTTPAAGAGGSVSSATTPASPATEPVQTHSAPPVNPPPTEPAHTHSTPPPEEHIESGSGGSSGGK